MFFTRSGNAHGNDTFRISDKGMPCSIRRRSLSLKEKHDIFVAVHDGGQSYSALAKSYGKSPSTISDIVKHGPYDNIINQRRYKNDMCVDLMESETKRMILLLREKSHSYQFNLIALLIIIFSQIASLDIIPPSPPTVVTV